MTTTEKQKEKKEPIAIVGIGCRLPGKVNHPEDFWQLLKNEVNAITNVPADRWSLEKYYDPDNSKAGKIKNSKGGFVEGIDKFDADFFKIFPAEASRMDPQQRLLLEVTYQALEDAGISLETMSGSLTAVFMGVFMNDYWDMQTSALQQEHISPHVPMGVSLTSIANRLSYVYNLKGPSVTLDTACSSSLVGVHLACRSIWSGESEMAIAGGVNAILRPESSIMMSKGNFLSPDGYCKSFDSRANGYVRSEGCGIVLLKSLSKAEEDGDHIYATIHGSAVNQDGYTEDGFTVPSVSAQTAMLQAAYQDAGVDPKEVSYVEAHGTGTPVGDPIETEAFGNVIGLNREENDKCLIGSVKTNIGHLESAAGIAGLIKLALILKHKQVPKNLHFENPNPKIPFDQYRLQVAAEFTELPRDKTIVAGVNSFGAGGTNAHVVMKSYEPSPVSADKLREVTSENLQLFTLSARGEEAMKQNVSQYVELLENTSASLSAVCYNLALRRSHHEHRLAVVCRSKEELVQHLQAFLADESRPGMSYQKVKPQFNPKVGFIFSGQGPQWYAMGQQLLKTNKAFKNIVYQIDGIFSELAGWSLLEEMQRDEQTSRVSETQIAQPAIMAVQIGVAEVLKNLGVMPQGCVGHSIGEVAAAYIAGALTLKQAVEVIYHRSRGQNQASNKGKMLAAGITLSEARNIIKGMEDRVSIAAINGPEMLTFSGDEEPLVIIAEQLDQQDKFHRFLRVNVPFHSHHMEPLKDELISSLSHLKSSEAKVALYSTVSGKQEDGLHLTDQYWYLNVREPVYFTDALAAMIEDGFNTFVEIAPHPVLNTGATDLLASKDVNYSLVLPTLRRKEEEELSIMTVLSNLHVNGYAMDWNMIFPQPSSFLKLPAYAWQHKSYWFESSAHRAYRLDAPIHPHLISSVSSVKHPHLVQWDMNLNVQIHKYIEDHKVDDTVIFPGTGHLELAYAAAQATFNTEFAFLEEVHFESALFLPEEGESPDARLEISSLEGDYQISTRSKQEEDANWMPHSRGRMNYLGDQFQSHALTLEQIKQQVTEPVSVSDFYLELKEGGLQYGETFRSITSLFQGEQALLAELKLSKRLRHTEDQFLFHPALLDACLHSILYAGKWTNDAQDMGIYLPVYISRFKVHQKPGKHIWCYTQLSRVEKGFLEGDYWIFNTSGELVAEIQGLRCKYIDGSRKASSEYTADLSYQYVWEEIIDEESMARSPKVNGDATGGCLIFADQHISETILRLFKQDNLYPLVLEKGEQFREVQPYHYQVRADHQGDIEEAFQRILSHGFRIDRMMYLWGLSEQNDTTNVEINAEQQSSLAQVTTNVFRAVIDCNLEPLFYLLTQQVNTVLDDEQPNLQQAALLGMGRVMMNECPFVKMSLVDVSAEADEQELQNLYDNFTLVSRPQYPEVAYRKDQHFVHKLVAVSREEAEQKAKKVVPAQASPFQLEVKEYGSLDQTVFREIPQHQLAEDEVEIEVRAAGLNFKDIMNIMGLLNDEAVAGGVAGKSLGLECSGIVSRVGKKVEDLQTGDKVMAWSANSYSGFAKTKASCVAKVPAALSFEEAASIPVVYLTAHYSLNHLARISEDDTVLIHSASGGVGIAAIMLAQKAGARIIATAGSEEKRAFVKALGIEHVLNSRETTFAEEIMAITDNKGVDVVLNSISGKGMLQSIKCLAPFGRFIEIGKTDIYQNTPLALKRLGNNVSYFAVDLDRLMLQKPRLGKRLFEEVATLFEEKQVEVHPLQVFKLSQLTEALRLLSKGNHVGKVVVSYTGDEVSVLPAKELRLSSEATYIVTGGASGFGLELANWLSEKGAKSLVLLSRSGCKYAADHAIIDQMQQRGVEVYPMHLDITDFKALSAVTNYIQMHLPPLKGIIHSAAVLEDATIANTDVQKYMKVFAPKALGAWNLHRCTENMDLDFFLSLSSISSLFGLPGQTNYSSANNFLDALAKYRQSKGLKASSVNLGVLGLYAGMSKEGGNVLNVLSNQGWQPMSLELVTKHIEYIILEQPAVRMSANLDWVKFRGFFTHLQNDVRFAEFTNDQANKSANAKSGLVGQLLSLPAEEQAVSLTQSIAESLAKILGTSAQQIDTSVSVANMGLDSLMLNQLRNWILQKLEVNYPLMKIAKGPSIAQLAEGVLVELKAKSGADKPALEEQLQDTSGISSEGDIEVLADGWLVRKKQVQAEVRQRIFCIHPVGAGASMFNHFLYNQPEDTEVLAFQLPGRENRKNEAPYENMVVLIEDMAKAVLPYLEKPYMVLGHSFGGIIGFELIRYVREHHGLEAKGLFVTGTIAPQLTKVWKNRDSISKTAVLSYSEEKLLSLLTYIDDVNFLRSILPVMRKDMPLIMSYVYQEKTLLDCPITAFAADKDEVVLIDEVGSWKAQTVGGFSIEVVPGDHWFLSRNKELIHQRLSEACNTLVNV